MKPTKKQRQIVESVINGNEILNLILAGAGTGKTELLNFLIVAILKNNQHSRILYVSFSKATIGNGQKRIGKASKVDYSTCHALALKMLTRAVKVFGSVKLFRDDVSCLWYDSDIVLKESLRVLDETTSLAMMNKIIETNGLDSSLSKTATDYLRGCYAHRKRLDIPNYLHGKLDVLLLCYAEEKRKRNAIDFNDMIVFGSALLRKYGADKLQFIDRYDFICVDESQDINGFQFDILRWVRSPKTKLIVAGDPCQQAYSFLGSQVDMFDTLQTFYRKRTKLHQITRSRRCPDAICRLSNAVTGQIDIQNTTVIKPLIVEANALPELIQYDAYQEGVDFIVAKILELAGPGKPLQHKEFVILMRVINGEDSSQKLSLLKTKFKQRGIAVKYKDQFNQEAWLYDLLVSAIRVALNRHEEDDLLKTLTLLGDQVLEQEDKVSLVQRLQSFAPKGTIEELVTHVADICDSCGFEVQQEVLKYFLKFQSQEQFLENWSDGLKNYFDHRNAVTISTIHSFKGHERRVVFLFGAEDKTIPYQHKDSGNTDRYLDDERCLLNIAVTRSSERLYLLYERSVCRPNQNISRFLSPLVKAGGYFVERAAQ